MRKLYLDAEKIKEPISVFVRDAEVVWAGTTIYSMAVSYRDAEYDRYAREYDIHFIFEDQIPEVSFYTVPQADIFAVDSEGGYLCTFGEVTYFEGDAPIIYIDDGRRCFLIAKNGKEFLDNVNQWKERKTPFLEIEFFSCQEEAAEKYEFIQTILGF